MWHCTKNITLSIVSISCISTNIGDSNSFGLQCEWNSRRARCCVGRAGWCRCCWYRRCCGRWRWHCALCNSNAVRSRLRNWRNIYNKRVNGYGFAIDVPITTSNQLYFQPWFDDECIFFPHQQPQRVYLLNISHSISLFTSDSDCTCFTSLTISPEEIHTLNCILLPFCFVSLDSVIGIMNIFLSFHFRVARNKQTLTKCEFHNSQISTVSWKMDRLMFDVCWSLVACVQCIYAYAA